MTKHYTQEFKESSANLAATSEKPVSQIARELGVNVNTLHGWVNRYYFDGSQPSSSPIRAQEQEELKHLRKEVIRLRQERDILKKAAAYFAKEA